MTDDQGWGVGEAGTHAAVATVPPQDAQLIGAEVVHSGRRRAMRRLRRDKAFLVSITILVLLVLSATIGAPIAAHLTGHGPTEQVPEAISIDGIPIGIMQHPYMADGVTPDESAQRFVLGADRLGRDQLVRLMYGARISLIVAFGATPATPRPLIGAAIVPAVCVPWPFRSWTADLFEQLPGVTCSDGSDVGVDA